MKGKTKFLKKTLRLFMCAALVLASVFTIKIDAYAEDLKPVMKNIFFSNAKTYLPASGKKIYLFSEGERKNVARIRDMDELEALQYTKLDELFYEVTGTVNLSEITSEEAFNALESAGTIKMIEPSENAEFQADKIYLERVMVSANSGSNRYDIATDIGVSWDKKPCAYFKSDGGDDIPDTINAIRLINFSTSLIKIDIEVAFDFRVGQPAFTMDMKDILFNPSITSNDPSLIEKVQQPLFVLLGPDFDESKILDEEYMHEHATQVPQNESYVVKSGDRFMLGFVLKLSDDSTLVEGNAEVTINGKKAFVARSSGYINVCVIMNAEDYSYGFMEESKNVSIALGKATNLSFHINAPLYEFESFSIGDIELIRNEDYTLSYGSTIVTLTEAGLAKINALPKGNYSVKATFRNGEEVAYGNLGIGMTPNTSDVSNIALLVAVMAIAGLTVFAMFTKRKKCDNMI